MFPSIDIQNEQHPHEEVLPLPKETSTAWCCAGSTPLSPVERDGTALSKMGKTKTNQDFLVVDVERQS